jgi:hypothetical protein
VTGKHLGQMPLQLGRARAEGASRPAGLMVGNRPTNPIEKNNIFHFTNLLDFQIPLIEIQI